jgi:tetratricopeptide (TPR) repeat protein
MQRIQKLQEMLSASPNDCFLMHALGLEFLKINQLEEAITYFEQVILTDKNYVGTYYHLAKTLERLNNKEEAIKIYEQGIEIANFAKDNHSRNELQMALEDLTD